MDRNIRKDQKDVFENLINLIPCGVMLINSNHDVEYHNRQFAGLIGDGNERFTTLNQWMNTAFPGNDYLHQVRSMLLYEMPCKQTDGKRTFHASVTTREGREKIIRFTSLPIDRHQFLLTGEDITEEKKREAQLEHAQKMEALGSMAGGVAHEINNILMGIQGYVSLMMLETQPSDSHYAKLQAIETQIRSGSDLTEQLLERAREGRLELKTVDLNELVKDAAAMLGKTRRDIHINEAYSAYLWAVEADTPRMEQALRKIFNRTNELLPDRGMFRIQTDNIMLDEDATRRGIKSGPYVRISLTVVEARLDEQSKLDLFSPVALLKKGNDSTGSGLSFAYGIIKAHQGLIDVESNAFTGTSFHIYLPASSKAPHKKKPEPPPVKTRSGKETILLVDDEKVITDVTGAMLTALGYQVLTASDGEEAVAMYSEQGHAIDLIIMDVVMPGMGGGEAIDLIRAINPSVKVILCSGYSMDGAVKAIMDKGVQTFLKKPFNLADFSVIIRKVLDG